MLMIQLGEFNVNPSRKSASTVSHVSLSKEKMNVIFTSRTSGVENNCSHLASPTCIPCKI